MWEPIEMHNDVGSIRTRRSRMHRETVFRERRTMVSNFAMSSYYLPRMHMTQARTYTLLPCPYSYKLIIYTQLGNFKYNLVRI